MAEPLFSDTSETFDSTGSTFDSDVTARGQIVAAMAAALAGLTSGATVIRAQPSPSRRGDLPAVFVWAGREEISRSNKAGDKRRILSLYATAAAEHADVEALDDLVERLAGEVEARLCGSAGFAALFKTLDLVALEKEASEDGEKPAAAVRLTFEAEYRTAAADPWTFIQ